MRFMRSNACHQPRRARCRPILAMAFAICVFTVNLLLAPAVHGQPTNLSGRWYGGSGWVTVKHSGSGVIITVEDTDYPTQWSGQLGNNTHTIEGTWESPKINQKGTFRFVYNPNHIPDWTERISGTYYIESKWGKDPRDFYADRAHKNRTKKR